MAGLGVMPVDAAAVHGEAVRVAPGAQSPAAPRDAKNARTLLAQSAGDCRANMLMESTCIRSCACNRSCVYVRSMKHTFLGCVVICVRPRLTLPRVADICVWSLT